MNKITKEDYKDLIGTRLDDISFSLYLLILNFSGSVGRIHIKTAKKLELRNNKTGEVQSGDANKGKACCICLNMLLNETIVSYDIISPKGDFILNFSNDYTLVIYNDLTWDDTYQINIDGAHFLSGDNVTEF